jgi:hypothetical protein
LLSLSALELVSGSIRFPCPKIISVDFISLHLLSSAWIVEVIADTTTRRVKRELKQHLFINSMRTAPETLLG